eukprot:7912414-Alexandrium_andersonii.AAC.1
MRRSRTGGKPTRLPTASHRWPTHPTLPHKQRGEPPPTESHRWPTHPTPDRVALVAGPPDSYACAF